MLAKSKHSRAPSDDASSVCCSRASRSVRSRSMSMRTSQSTLFGPKVRMAMASSSDQVCFDGLERGTFAQVRGRRRFPLVLEVVGDLDELEGEAVRIAEVHPPPPGQRSL